MAAKKSGQWDISIEINGKEVANTLKGVGAEVGKLSNQLKGLTPGTEEFIKKSAELDKARKQYASIKEEIYGTNEALDLNTDAFTKLFSAIRSGDFKGISEGLRGLAGGIGTMTKAAWAFIATPLGAILAAIALVLAPIISYLTSTQEGIDKVTAVTRPLMAIMESLKGVLQSVGKVLFEAFANPKKSAVEIYEFVKEKVIRVFDAYWKVLSGIATLDFSKVKEGISDVNDIAMDAVNTIKDGAKATGDFFKEAAEKGAEIDRLTKSIEKSQLEYNRQVKITGDAIEDQLLISKNTALSAKEREAAANKIIELTEELSQKEEDIVQKKIKRLTIEQSLNDTSREGVQDMIDLENELDAAQDRGDDARREQMRVTAVAAKERQAEAKRQADERQREIKEAEAAAEAKLKIYQAAEEELNNFIKDQQTERSNNTLTESARELAIIDQKYAKLREKFALSEEQKTELSKEQIIAREAQLEELEVQIKAEKEEKIIERNEEFRIKLAEIEEENRLMDEEVRFERLAEEAEREDQRMEILLLKTQYLATQQLNIARDKELAAVDDVENAEMLKQAIRDKYNKKQAAVDDTFQKGKQAADKQTAENEISLTLQRSQAYGEMFGNVSELLGKNTAAGKAAAVAQATINTYQGVTEVWTTPSVLPEPFATISRIASTGMVLASGIKSVNTIKSTSTPSFFQGGHTGDKAIYYDEYGKVTGAVHEKEWVAPRMMTENPRYASTFQWLEKERLQQTGKSYFNGGSTSTETPDFMNSSNTTEVSTSSVLTMLLTVLNKMMDDGVTTGPILIGDDELQQIQKRTVIIENARESAKIK